MNRGSNKKFLKGFIFTLLFTFFFYIGSGVVHASTGDNDALNQVRALIQNGYIKDVPNEVLNSNNIDEIIKGVNDPYTQYFSPEDFKNFVNSINNSFCGIGIYNDESPDGIKIKSVMDGSPALEAGLKSGDIIIKADGQSLKGLDLSEAVKYIKGKEGTKVSLEILRGENVLKFTVERRQITLPTVQWNVIDGHIGYIRILSFGEDTPELFSQGLNELNAKKVDKFIVDLRDNTGGYTKSAYDIAGYFIGENTAIVMKDKANREYEFKGIDHGYTIDKKIIFLINDYTASASEILSAAVKDYNKAFFVGIKSYGKGVQQTTFQLQDGGVLKLTTQSFYSPKGNAIQKVGITPDFNTKDVDSLAVAELLYSGTNKIDKRDMIKVTINKEEFLINLNKARNKEYWKAFNYILENVDKDNIYVGTKNEWVKANKEDLEKKFNIYFNDYKKLPTLVKAKDNVKFTIKFNKDIDSTTVNKNTIKLIKEDTFDEAEVEYKVEGGNTIILTPKKAAKLEGKYYLMVQDVKSKEGKGLNMNTAVNVDIK